MSPEIHQQVVDVLTEASPKVTAAGAGAGVIGVVLSSQFVGLIGVVIALMGLLMQWYFNRKRDRREQAEHEARMRALQ